MNEHPEEEDEKDKEHRDLPLKGPTHSPLKFQEYFVGDVLNLLVCKASRCEIVFLCHRELVALEVDFFLLVFFIVNYGDGLLSFLLDLLFLAFFAVKVFAIIFAAVVLV